MELNGVTAANNPLSSPISSQSPAELGKEEFLRLLVTQLSNQDPLNPLEGQEFAAQLAQFSSVEQLINLNEAMQAGQELNAILTQSINSGVAAGLIGKHAEAISSEVNWDGDEDTPLHFELDGPAASVEVNVVDANGQTVRSFTLSNLSAESHTLSWDGTNDDGVTVPTGSYSLSISAVDARGEPVGALPSVQGRVDRITFDQGGIMLWINGVAIPMGNVTTVKE